MSYFRVLAARRWSTRLPLQPNVLSWAEGEGADAQTNDTRVIGFPDYHTHTLCIFRSNCLQTATAYWGLIGNCGARLFILAIVFIYYCFSTMQSESRRRAQ